MHTTATMGKRGGIRQRLGLEESDQPAAGGASASGEINLADRRSVRRRVLAAPKASASGSLDCDLPLFASLRRDWSQGLLSAKQVQHYAAGAGRQRAMGMATMAQAGSRVANPSI